MKSKIFPEKVPAMKNDALTSAINFISTYPFWDINTIILQHLHLTQLICTNIDQGKLVDSICCHH